MSAAIALDDVTHFYRHTKALDGLSLTVQSGEVYALLGPNGAGKTTCLRAVAGLVRPSRGTATTLGLAPIEQAVKLKPRIGYLSETLGLFEWMTIRKHIEFHRAFYPAWDAEFAHELLTALGLSTSTRIKTLSKGQKRQVAMILVAAQRPELMVLDEPAGGLDPGVRRSFLDVIIRLIQDERRTMLFSSHITSDVERVATRVGFLKAGKLVLEEELDTLKESVKKVVLSAEARTAADTLNWLSRSEFDDVIEGVVQQSDTSVLDAVAVRNGAVVHGLPLEDIYLSVIGSGKDAST